MISMVSNLSLSTSLFDSLLLHCYSKNEKCNIRLKGYFKYQFLYTFYYHSSSDMYYINVYLYKEGKRFIYQKTFGKTRQFVFDNFCTFINLNDIFPVEISFENY